jgi:N-acetylglutamate synthase-like GNAT family acetyltransferase
VELSIVYKKLETKDEILKTKTLILEYIKWLNQDLSYQNIDDELLNFPEKYKEPSGAFVIAKIDENVIGCAGLKKFSDEICEMKRLYVLDNFKGKGIGKKLTEKIIAEAKTKNYEKMRLDTFDKMEAALEIYYKNGFKKIDPYYHNPYEGVIYLEKIL